MYIVYNAGVIVHWYEYMAAIEWWAMTSPSDCVWIVPGTMQD